LTYVDDCITVGDLMDHIEALKTLLHIGTDNFILRDEGSIDKSLGVSITQLDAKSFDPTQPFLIEHRTTFLNIDKGRSTSEQETPVGKPLLNKDLNEVPHRYSWEYRGAIDIDIAGYVGFFCVVKKGSKRQTCVCRADMSTDMLPTLPQKLSKRVPTLSNRDADADMLV